VGILRKPKKIILSQLKSRERIMGLVFLWDKTISRRFFGDSEQTEENHFNFCSISSSLNSEYCSFDRISRSNLAEDVAEILTKETRYLGLSISRFYFVFKFLGRKLEMKNGYDDDEEKRKMKIEDDE